MMSIQNSWRLRASAAICALMIAAGAPIAALSETTGGYRAIDPTMADKTVILTGHDLTIEQVLEVARHGAQVQLSAEAQQREADNYGLLLEAPAEGVSVYWFTRGTGGQRETHIFDGDPTTPENKTFLEKRMMSLFQRGAYTGDPPEVLD
jgi:histidine ammonia-lyase